MATEIRGLYNLWDFRIGEMRTYYGRWKKIGKDGRLPKMLPRYIQFRLVQNAEVIQ